MSYPYDSDTLDALDNLSSYYNGNAYNSSTNPGGMAAGGHRINFITSLQDVATVAASVADAASSAATSAVAAASSATSAAASLAALAGTSTTSVSIGTGSKSFTTQTSKSFEVGSFVLAESDANPTTHYMLGQVSAYDSLTGALTIVVPAGASSGSGSRSDWTLLGRVGSPGPTGSAGTTGAMGATPALQWAFGNGTSDTDPGNGVFMLNNASPASATFIYFDNLDINSNTVTAQVDSWDDSTNLTNRGTLRLVKITDQTKYVEYIVSGAVSDGTGYRKVPVTYVASNGTFTNGDTIAVAFYRTGNAGADGAGAGDTISDISSVTDGNFVIFNGSSGKHVTNIAYGFGTSGANIGALNGNNTYSGTASFTGTLAYSSTLIGTVANANALTVGPNGVTNPALTVDTSTLSAATGLKITALAAAAGLALAVISSGTDENLTLNAKGAGTITLNGTATGLIALSRNTTIAGTATITSTSSSALAVGRQGATNPVLQVDAATGSVATGLKVTGAAATGGVALAAISSGTNENLTLDAKGSGTLTLNGTATGSVIASRLFDISGAAAGQIKFPASQNASADANTLDDYEEGTWTPALSFGGGSTSLTYSSRAGTYTKIGNRVFWTMNMTLSNKGSSTGSASIGGLPFTVGAGTGAAIGFTDNFTPGAGQLPQFWVQSGGTAITIRYNIQSSGGNGGLDHSAFANNTTLVLSGNYEV